MAEPNPKPATIAETPAPAEVAAGIAGDNAEVATAPKKPSKPQEYVLRTGFKHSAVVQGEIVLYDGDTDNNVVTLTDEQYTAFKDKFEAPKAVEPAKKTDAKK